MSKFIRHPKEEPNAFMIRALAEAERDESSPTFDNVEDFIKWLDNGDRK